MVVPHKSTNMASNHISFNEARSAEKHIASVSEKIERINVAHFVQFTIVVKEKNKSPLKT